MAPTISLPARISSAPSAVVTLLRCNAACGGGFLPMRRPKSPELSRNVIEVYAFLKLFSIVCGPAWIQGNIKSGREKR